MKTYVTTLGRRLKSLLLGAIVGGALMALPLLGPYSQGAAFSSGALVFANLLLGCFIVCTLGWLIGLVVLGLPCWWLIERLKYANPWAAATAGAVVPTLMCIALFGVLERGDAARMRRPFHWPSLLEPRLALIGALFVCVGCVVGLLMWRYAYRQKAEPEDVFR